MPTLTRVDAAIDQRLGGLGRRDVAGDDVDVLERAAQRLHDVDHALRVAVRGVDDEHVDVGRDQRLGALERVARDADGGADAQPPERVLARVRILDRLLDVLDGDQALQPEVVIDDEELLDFLLCRISRASSSVVPTGTVMRLCFVITSATGRSMLVSKRRSRLVRMPTSRPSLLPSSVIGTPEMR